MAWGGHALQRHTVTGPLGLASELLGLSYRSSSHCRAHSPQDVPTRWQACPDHRRSNVSCSVAASDVSLVGVGEIADVEDVEGIRIIVGQDNKPLIEYSVKWKDGNHPTWEPVENLADNLLRDFEDKWWKCCREGDEETMRKMLENSPNVLPFCVDSNERSALHFSAALGKAEICAFLCKAGAEVDLQDKDGYTPLHMAVGYSFVSTVKILLEAGASPEINDSQGRNVVQLVDSIRDSLPFNPQLAQKRIALEEVSALLTGNLFEEVIPRRILEERPLENGSKEYLIQWYDNEEDSWVKEADISQDVIDDYKKGYEYGTAKELLKMKKRGDERLYLVRWTDGSEPTWEFEDDISPVLVKAFDLGKRGKDLESLLSDPSQWNFGDDTQTPKKRRRRRRRKPKRDVPSQDAGLNGASDRPPQTLVGNGSTPEPSSHEAEMKDQQNLQTADEKEQGRRHGNKPVRSNGQSPVKEEKREMQLVQ